MNPILIIIFKYESLKNSKTYKIYMPDILKREKTNYLYLLHLIGDKKIRVKNCVLMPSMVW